MAGRRSSLGKDADSSGQAPATGTGQAVIERQIRLPLQEAFRICIRNIMIRLGRSTITASGVFLGIAFLMSVLTSQAVIVALHGQIDPSVQARQGWLVKMSLLVCALGITNSMFMAVTERFREIGTMKCLGALDSFIVRLFLIESGLLGGAGSVAGAIVGFVVMMLISTLQGGVSIWVKINYLVELRNLGFCVAAGIILSIAAAVPPAIKAARMPPASALRTEV